MSGRIHWINQRLSAVWLLAVILYGALSFAWHDTALLFAQLARPHGIIWTLALLVPLYWHGWLGVQMVIDDYCQDAKTRRTLHKVSNGIFGFFFALGLCGILMLGLG